VVAVGDDERILFRRNRGHDPAIEAERIDDGTQRAVDSSVDLLRWQIDELARHLGNELGNE
jgi:hypothetical protein